MRLPLLLVLLHALAASPLAAQPIDQRFELEPAVGVETPLEADTLPDSHLAERAVSGFIVGSLGPLGFGAALAASGVELDGGVALATAGREGARPARTFVGAALGAAVMFAGLRADNLPDALTLFTIGWFAAPALSAAAHELGSYSEPD